MFYFYAIVGNNFFRLKQKKIANDYFQCFFEMQPSETPFSDYFRWLQ